MKRVSVTNAADSKELKQLMKMIIDECYPFLFESSQLLMSIAEDMEQTLATKKLKGAMGAIYNALERMYYKEKIVLFPFLEKHFEITEKASVIPAINNSVEEGMRIAKHIDSFRMLALGRDATESTPPFDNKALDAMGTFESAWWALCAHRNKLFESLVILKETKD